MFIACRARLLNADRHRRAAYTYQFPIRPIVLETAAATLADSAEVAKLTSSKRSWRVFLGVEQDTAISVLVPKGRTIELERKYLLLWRLTGWKKAGQGYLESRMEGPWILPRSELAM